MRRLVPALLLLALFATPAEAKVRTGPAGDSFYEPPSPLPGKRHGAAIWARSVPRPSELSGARSQKLLLYRSVGSDGRAIAVSGTVLLPKRKPPRRGGWPVVTYAHGSSGIADQCAPSRDPDASFTTYTHALVNRWLRLGYVVVRTDYQGLGTPGEHEYLVGVPEGRSVLDIARAARAVHPRVGNRLLISGHSQGGQAALWAASLARRYTPDLKLRGTVAFAPASHVSEQIASVRAIESPGGGLSAIASMILRAMDVSQPGLGVPSLLSDRARELYPETLTKCLSALAQTDSFGGMAPADIPRDEADLTPLTNAIDEAIDPENINVPGRLQLLQGTTDGTVFKLFTDQLDEKLRRRGTRVDYRTYEGVSHGGVITAGEDDAIRFSRARLRR